MRLGVECFRVYAFRCIKTDSYGLHLVQPGRVDPVPVPAPSPVLAPAPLGHGREVECRPAAGGPFTDGCRYSAMLG